jgi:hypothetical protein
VHLDRHLESGLTLALGALLLLALGLLRGVLGRAAVHPLAVALLRDGLVVALLLRAALAKRAGKEPHCVVGLEG